MVSKNKRLMLALVDVGLTQRELARRSGVHETTLSRIVNGRLIPSSDEARRIAKVLGRAPSDLFDIVD